MLQSNAVVKSTMRLSTRWIFNCYYDSQTGVVSTSVYVTIYSRTRSLATFGIIPVMLYLEFDPIRLYQKDLLINLNGLFFVIYFTGVLITIA